MGPNGRAFYDAVKTNSASHSYRQLLLQPTDSQAGCHRRIADRRRSSLGNERNSDIECYGTVRSTDRICAIWLSVGERAIAILWPTDSRDPSCRQTACFDEPLNGLAPIRETSRHLPVRRRPGWGPCAERALRYDLAENRIVRASEAADRTQTRGLDLAVLV